MSDTPFVIKVPRTNWNGGAADIRSRLQTWEWHWKQAGTRSEVVLDFSGVQFLEPWALSMFTAYALKLQLDGAVVRAFLDPANPANVYLAQMGLEEAIRTGRTEVTTQRWAESTRNTGLHVIRGQRDIDAFRRSTQGLTSVHRAEALDALGYAVVELARNTLQHADSPIGGVAIAQHFPERGALQIAICDVGRGVLGSLRTRYPELRTDLEALRLAILPHASGAVAVHSPYGSSFENAGIGLSYCREIAWRAGGSFWIASGQGLLGARHPADNGIRDRDEPERIYRRIELWPGTVVSLDFPVEGVQDFAQLLKACGQLADSARRQAGAAAIDFLDASDDAEVAHRIAIEPFQEDPGAAARVRDTEIRPYVERGETVLLDFSGVRYSTQSFIHALLADVLKLPGSIVRLSFANCSRSTKEVVRAVAAYSASYRQIV